jgi:asparagine synthase (glutamine-hydrolysing)
MIIEFRFKIELLKAINYDGDFYYDILSLSFQENELKEILKANDYVEDPLSYYKKNGNQNKTLTDFRNIDKIISLEGDMIVKVDRTSMLASLNVVSF